MKRMIGLVLMAVLLLPGAALAESLSAALDETVNGLDLTVLEQFLVPEDPFAQTGGLRETVRQLASGTLTVSPEGFGRMLSSALLSAWKGSWWRITRLLAPSLLLGILRRLLGRDPIGLQTVGSLLLCAFLTEDVSVHMALCVRTVSRMSEAMQGLFPMLLTMMAAVGGAAGASVLRPAVAAATGGITLAIQTVTLPLTAAAAALSLLNHLGQGVKVARLGKLARQAASWSLGLGLTAFLGLMAAGGFTAVLHDGVTIRTAKYALDHFVPMVGGLFADTVDALVGSGLLVQSALGITGLVLLLSVCLLPLCQTFAAALLYRLTAALLEPVAEGPLADCIHDCSEVLMLLFVVQLGAAAMFLLLTGQLVLLGGVTVMVR